MNKKNYSVKINDFKNLKTKSQFKQDEVLNCQVEVIQEKYNCIVNKALFKGKGLVLAIAIDNNTKSPLYIITGRPCYQKSIIDILASVKIDDYIIDNKQDSNLQMSIDDLKSLLLS